MPTINLKNRTMYYEEFGTGETILFGHSFLWDREMWQDQIALLSEHYHCIVPDLWGHGKSGLIGKDKISLGDLADDYLSLMDVLGIEKFSIIGLSVGGMWAAHIAAKHPQRVEKLVLCDTDLGTESFFNKLRYSAMIKIIEKENTIPKKLIEKVLPLFFSKETLTNNSELVSYFKEKLSATKQKNVATIVALARAIFWRDSFLEELKHIKAQTKIIVGAEDVARPPRESERLATFIPKSTLSVIANAGHIPAQENPEAFNDVLREFFQLSSNYTLEQKAA